MRGLLWATWMEGRGILNGRGGCPRLCEPGFAEDRGICEESLAVDCVDSDVSTEHQNALPRPQQAPGPHPRSTTGLSLDPQPTPPRALPCPIRPFLSNRHVHPSSRRSLGASVSQPFGHPLCPANLSQAKALNCPLPQFPLHPSNRLPALPNQIRSPTLS